MVIRNKKEYERLKEGGRILAFILRTLTDEARPGISTLELDAKAETMIREAGGIPAFKGYRIKGVRRAYPATICASINDAVVHGIPSATKILKDGDIVGIDIGMQYKDFFTDMAVTVGVGVIDPASRALINATAAALAIGIQKIKSGMHIGDVGRLIQTYLEKQGLGVIRDLAGHGIGKKLHEEPLVPNFGSPGTGPVIREGEVLAIEPMATQGDWRVRVLDDEWTIVTKDGSRAAHFEHTVIVRRSGAEIITS